MVAIVARTLADACPAVRHPLVPQRRPTHRVYPRFAHTGAVVPCADHASSGPWTKVIAVLTERNWVQRSGLVHGAGDHGPNPSAEIAMQIVGRQAGPIAGNTP